MSVNDWMMVTDEVRQAVFAGDPIVAVPSSLFMGKPTEQQALYRACLERQDARMALVGVWKGKLAVGLCAEQMQTLASSGVNMRASRSDFAPLCARRASAAAGVALTMLAAQRCGIDVVAAGAMEGVQQTAQGACCSPDLMELSQTTVLVVGAGWQEQVDRALTMTCMEMQDIPVALWQTEGIEPGCMQTGRPLHRLDTPEQAGAMFRAHRDVCRKGGLLLMAQAQPDAYQACVKSCEVAARVAGHIMPVPFSEPEEEEKA